MVFDTRGVTAPAGEPDLLIAHSRVLDERGALCADDTARIDFSVEGAAAIAGQANVAAEAGIASVVLRVPADADALLLSASRRTDDAAITASRRWRRTKDQAVSDG